MLSDKFIQLLKGGSKILLLSLIAACVKESPSSEIPSIQYESYEVQYDTAGKTDIITVKFSFADGDGDIGYRDQDTVPPFTIGEPYFYNLHASFYSEENGNKVYYINQSLMDTINFSQRLQSITPEGKFKSISGTMDLKIDFTLLKIFGYNPKNCRLDIWLNDRKLQKSQTITTPLIPVDL